MLLKGASVSSYPLSDIPGTWKLYLLNSNCTRTLAKIVLPTLRFSNVLKFFSSSFSKYYALSFSWFVKTEWVNTQETSI